jgi:hypothetical protein
MAKTNFQYEKRQRELEKKKKADEKARRKLEAKTNPDGSVAQEDGTEEADADADTAEATPAQSNPA